MIPGRALIAGRASIAAKRRAAVVALAFAAVLAMAAPDAVAVQPDELLADPALEARARVISKGLRCVVCQNQSIDDSNADLAREMRLLVRERVVAGDSNAEATNFLVARYGNFVLLKPPMQANTYALWYGPAATLIFAAGAVAVYFRRRRIPAGDNRQATAPLDAGEVDRLARVLEDEGER